MWRGLLLILLLAGSLGACRRAEAPSVLPAAPESALARAVLAGQVDGVVLAENGQLQVLPGAVASPADAPYTVAGTSIGPLQPLEPAAGAIHVAWEGTAPPGTAIRLEVRGRRPDGRLTPWEETAGGIVRFDAPVVAVQYRLTLLAMADGPSPSVSALALTPAADATPSVGGVSAHQATFRVYATRIGLVGNRTSNGHIITPEDRFVALPSRRVLAARGGSEYQVRVEHRGRSLTLPVWDTGPWNIRDNWWDAGHRRDMWNDLPTGQPQSAAAYFDAYHGGRDGFGRRVLNPAGIDLSDAAFYELGLRQSDWVLVTPLWR